eukprot:5655712-Pyramimonas_sp.AAC.2
MIMIQGPDQTMISTMIQGPDRTQLLHVHLSCDRGGDILGFEKLSRCELDDIHTLWVAEYKRRFGVKATLQSLGHLLVNFQFVNDDDDITTDLSDIESAGTLTPSGVSTPDIEDPWLDGEAPSLVDEVPSLVDEAPAVE